MGDEFETIEFPQYKEIYQLILKILKKGKGDMGTGKCLKNRRFKKNMTVSTYTENKRIVLLEKAIQYQSN